ncbi:AAA family ATPase [Nonomuraea insulae]|uniref:AAA family ATPase n=1 Tax=Nonomuraea insulae TaxID=1616787 RepID=A0ABW1CXC7_9ACTN
MGRRTAVQGARAVGLGKGDGGVLTRIEIDGFKSFLDFELDVPPFLALVGPNSSGKSNLLDALAFVRGAILSDGGATSHDPLRHDPLLNARRGKPQELFHKPAGSTPVNEFTIRVAARNGHEEMTAEVEADRELGDWHVDRVDAGRLWRREVSSWHFHMPDPAVMRQPVSRLDRRPLAEDAANLAGVLGRMADTGELDDLMVDLSALVPDVTGVRPLFDERSEEWSFDLLIDHEPVPCRLASDGTLRVLALLAALYDQSSSGLLMVEEIENGLHPSRLGELLERVVQRVGVKEDSWRQVILTTHSPVAVSTLYATAPDALVFLDSVWRTGGGNPRSRVTIPKPVRPAGEPGTFVSPRQVRNYLSTVGRAP